MVIHNVKYARFSNPYAYVGLLNWRAFPGFVVSGRSAGIATDSICDRSTAGQAAGSYYPIHHSGDFLFLRVVRNDR